MKSHLMLRIKETNIILIQLVKDAVDTDIEKLGKCYSHQSSFICIL